VSTQDHGEFEYLLNRVERKAVLRTGVWVTLLVATGLALFLYSLQAAQKARLAAEKSKQDALNYVEQAHKYQAQIHELEAALSNSREAVQYVSQGINLYHAGNYGLAVNAYDEALRLDPNNPYVLDLKGYSLFKMKDLAGAISVLRESISGKREYAWGYFDLARAYCAEREYDLATQSLQEALRLRPGLRQFMNGDGEFLRLCAPIKRTFSQPSPPPTEPHEGTAKIRPPLPSETPSTGGKSHETSRNGAENNETKRGCRASFLLSPETGFPSDQQGMAKDALADLQGRVSDTLWSTICDLASSNFNVSEISITFQMTFEIRDDGSVGGVSIKRHSGSPQFDDGVRKAVEEARFPQLAGQHRLGSVKVALDMSYSRKSGSSAPPGE
jgi:tetratricopeptide (TPR) repeat protein